MQASKSCFSAAGLFYFVTLCATATSLFGWLGVPVGCFVMLFWTQLLAGAYREREAAEHTEEVPPPEMREASGLPCPGHHRTGASSLELVVVLLIVVLVVGLLIPAGQDYDPQRQAETSLRMVAKAVEAYEQHYGALPPAQVIGADGRPLHSWRALILPFLGEEKLAAAYRWDEPWNGPNNSSLAKYRPWHYRLYYGDSESRRTTTAVHLLSGQDDQLYVVEHEQAECNWMEPTQLRDWQAFTIIPEEQQGFWQLGFFSSLYRGRLAVTTDCSLRLHPLGSIGDDLPHLPLQRSVPSQRELVDVGAPYRRWHWDNGLRLAMFLTIALYPLRWLTHK